MIGPMETGDWLVAGLPGPELTSAVERALADLAPAGVILFARNLKGVGQARDLLAGVRETLGPARLLAVDEEGGPVNRLVGLSRVFGSLPDARTQAGWGGDELEEVWYRVGRTMAALGFNVDFAPVADLDDGPGANAIGRRSFGTDPGRAVACAARVLAGLRRAGIAGCLKHFPGLGGTDLDTHLALAASPVDAAALRNAHARPYRELRDVAPLVMTAHAHYPAVDGAEPLPATFSRRLIEGWLRDDIGYDGLVISDDLEMGAVAGGGSPGTRARRAIEAGCDLALFCGDLDAPRRARDELARALKRGDLSAERLAATRRRKALVLGRLGPPAAAPPRFEDEVEKLRTVLEEIA